ncbi:RelA/SpoT domain-containing protein [Dankookia rubra]|nr:RelA/SpoT domain-containing protein [Dankookia rubra]
MNPSAACQPGFEHSGKEVARAGDVIASGLAWSPDTEDRIRRAFQVAHGWREFHSFPMRSVRYSVVHHMKAAGVHGITAARLKRMQAIRGKLLRAPRKLNQLQDLAGCRAILDDIRDVRELVAALRTDLRHELHWEDDYIAGPKTDGYRSHHLIVAFRAKNGAERRYDGRRVEVQIRTRLQHAWATAVEAVGLFRGEGLKNREGSAEWLRLFAFVSAEFAEAEGCPPTPGIPGKAERIAEIRRLAAELDAPRHLEQIRHGVRGTDLALDPNYKPTHFLIRYDHATATVRVEPHSAPRMATASYESAEVRGDQLGAGERQTVVLVEVDKIQSLKAAYPNYFGDVEEFGRQLAQITEDGAATEYAVPARQPPKHKLAPYGDLSWLRGSRLDRSFRR